MLRLDSNLVWIIVDIIVLYLLLRHFLIKPVTDIMEKRQAMIDQNIADARKSESQALELKSQYEGKLAGSAEEGRVLVEEARAEAKAAQERMIKEAGEQAERIVENAHRTAQADQERAMREAESQVAKLVIAAAAKVVQSEINDKKNQSLYDKYIAEAGDSHDAGSK